MYYAQIRKYDTANGPGIRSSLFVSGCTHDVKDVLMKSTNILSTAIFGHQRSKMILLNIS